MTEYLFFPIFSFFIKDRLTHFLMNQEYAQGVSQAVLKVPEM